MLIDLIILKTSICVVVKHDFVSTYSIKHIISVAVWCRLALFCIKCFPLQDLHELTPCVTSSIVKMYIMGTCLSHIHLLSLGSFFADIVLTTDSLSLSLLAHNLYSHFSLSLILSFSELLTPFKGHGLLEKEISVTASEQWLVYSSLVDCTYV